MVIGIGSHRQQNRSKIKLGNPSKDCYFPSRDKENNYFNAASNAPTHIQNGKRKLERTNEWQQEKYCYPQKQVTNH